MQTKAKRKVYGWGLPALPNAVTNQQKRSKMPKRKKIGILTAGGDCPGLNAVIRAVTKKVMIDYDYDVIGFKDGYYGIVKND